MRRQILPAVRMIVVATLALGVLYPLAMTGLAQGLFHHRAEGSLIERDGRVIGSSLVGQAFTEPQYFHTRVSAAGALASGSLVDGEPADPSDLSLAASGASNQGPTNPDLLASIEERTADYRQENGLADDVEVPIDAVTASGSGVDPHISVANARLQANRVAGERGLDLQAVLRLIDRHTDGRSLGFLGERGVNVLELNLALDDLAG
jgi:K+-transporting ATPase ATPase C chain